MAVGIPSTKAQVDGLLSGLTRNLRQVVDQIHEFNDDVIAMADADLTALGYSADDVTLIRDISADLLQLYAIFGGAAALAQPKDFTANISKVWGIGP